MVARFGVKGQPGQRADRYRGGMPDPDALPRDGRRARSRRTRRRIVEAAYRLFAEHGYAIPLVDIADAADVSVQTLYASFRTKPGLVGDVLQLAVHGDDLPEPPHRRPWFAELVAADEPGRAIGIWVANTLPIYARVAPLAGMFLSEPELASLWSRSEQLRLDGFREVMELVAAKGPLRQGVDLGRATDIMFVLLGPLVYPEFVGGRQWPAERWGAWVTDTLTTALFEP
jgi:AcrR family transcriptional regulator